MPLFCYLRLLLSEKKYIMTLYIVKIKEVWKMKKKIALICATIMLIMSFAQSVGAINVIMNSSFLKFPDQEPVIKNDITLVPLRTVAEALGLEVTWDDPSDTVVLKKDNFFIELVIGSTTAKTPAGTKKLEVAPEIINSRTMVPLRFIAEELGLTVLWNQEYQRVIINGEVDTQTIVKPPVEEATDIEAATDFSGEVSEGKDDITDEEREEETEFVDNMAYTSIFAPSSSIMLEIPDTYLPENTDNEESFAFRSLDGFDAQHTYNWEIVSQYESYADAEAKSGILFIVQEMEPYQGEEYDVSSMNQDYPEPPERPEGPDWPDIDWQTMLYETERVCREQVFIDLEVEIPENLMEMEIDELLELLGLESEEAYNEQYDISSENADLSQVPGYDELLIYQEENEAYQEEMRFYNEEYRAYQEEYNEISRVKNYAVRNFSTLASQASDDDWATLFSSMLNTDGEVRYESVEVLDFNGKKVVHAVIYAEDPDDEQGTYEYYRYQDGDTLVTIFGGTLFAGEPGGEISEILANMIIQ